MVGDVITGLDYNEMSKHIEAAIKFNFIHVVKKKDKGKL